jgi:endoglucanase
MDLARRRAIALILVGLGAVAGGCRAPQKSAPARDRAAGLLGRPLALRGVSLAGAEFGVDTFGKGTLPGTPGVHYVYPDPRFAHGYGSAAYFLARGLSTFRVPFRWERLQPARRQPFDRAEQERLETTVSDLTVKGAYVVLDVHNYGRYRTGVLGAEIPAADFADLWARLAASFKGDPKVVFALMNEPHDMPTEAWVASANAAIRAIRDARAPNLILVSGNGWSGAHSWGSGSYGTPNARALLAVDDPGHYLAFEVHQHLDEDSSGTSPRCAGPDVGPRRMKPFTDWLRAHRLKGFLGELSAGDGPECLEALGNLLAYVDENEDVYVGWTYWAAGPMWGDYFASIEPRRGQDRPQLGVLVAHLGH